MILKLIQFSLIKIILADQLANLYNTINNPQLYDKKLRPHDKIKAAEVNVMHSDVLKAIWKPDLFFSNEKEGSPHKIITENALIRIREDGLVYVSIRLTVVAACRMYLNHFPMDVQVCNLRAESFGYNTNDVQFHWTDTQTPPLDLQDDLQMPQFKLVGHQTAVCDKVYTSGTYTCIEAKFILKREIGYYLIQIYVPSFLLVILSWVSFWISIEATPARISLGITTVLTISSMRNGAAMSLPKVSYIKAIDIWLSFCMVLVFAAVLEYAIANYLYRQSDGILARNSRRLKKGHCNLVSKYLKNCRTLRKRKATKKEYTNGSAPKINGSMNGSVYCANYSAHYDSPSYFNTKLNGNANIHSQDHSHFDLHHQVPKNSTASRAEDEDDELADALYYRHLSKKIEKESRVLFPFIFTAFCLCYWIYYMVWSNELQTWLDDENTIKYKVSEDRN
ncbi:Oidioi.mRNA.OKI2018_I69.chr1.g3616.t2.cds [Oikopleura dioica]|uniref:Oidioi.mRNA.OKI2018_I69.chr1.g3616.t2.cds n=1 Tax=Oikopleura dioica TaxID=34765 RepID=A0ABN7SY81_OIKDI|nr:Oidioi.mRNA.OKI2018_I69.chr1.g3616.t2.cds [Oikopleura dioica]